MTFSLTEKEARRLGLLPDAPKTAKTASQKTSKRLTVWTRSNIEDWEGPDGWRVGISRGLYDGVMRDMVVGWRDDRTVHYVGEWEEFRAWSIETVEMKLKNLESKDAG